MTNPQRQDAGLDNANNKCYFNISEPVIHQSYSVVEQFRQVMRDAGIAYSGEIIADGRLHRFHIEGHKRGSLNGAYTLHIDGCPAGWFMDFTTGLSQTWNSSSSSRIPYTVVKKIKEAKAQREAEIRQKHKEAANKAVSIWRKSKPIARRENHQYLITKQIQQHSARLYHESLVIPIYNESDQLVNLQFISPQGDKRFLYGGRKRGCFHIIGDLTKRILICEGFATGASLYEDCGQRVVIAFDAGNLLSVTKNIRELSPDSEIIICGDNDLSGVGKKKAREAALAIGGKVMIPPVPGQDWNDYLTGGRQYG
ncbi:toprim domain-containing protein [Nitrosomonas sp. Nm166]|uniref:toprim domain-containing protein n=1 Tax=Nitrosomonas sp. Nm166 TaxID=1881054 RepID=UPI0008DF0F99|nr:toprim domain-containing protein [Nitrosomonas sp. Nm166]SFE41225.1 putative DNA primase/helicase [Nitrosomonas sp. Nm166]